MWIFSSSQGKRRSIDKTPPDCLKINGRVPVVKMDMLSPSKEASRLKRYYTYFENDFLFLEYKIVHFSSCSVLSYRTARHEFDQKDRQKIIDFIIANQDFNPADPEYWQKMAKVRVLIILDISLILTLLIYFIFYFFLKTFSSHTWQSLKGHFRNKIYPSIHEYKLSKELEEKIR